MATPRRRRAPYIRVTADAPLDPRWTAESWFAWSRILGTCRAKLACTAATYPAAVLTLRPHELCSIVSVGRIDRAIALLAEMRAVDIDIDVEGLAGSPPEVRWTLGATSAGSSAEVRPTLYRITVRNYAEHQDLRLASLQEDGERAPGLPTSLRPNGPTEEEEPPVVPPAAPSAAATGPAAAPPPPPVADPPERPPPKRKPSREPMPEGFPDATLRAELAADFPDLALDDAIAEFLAYAEREHATYIGLRGWRQALRGALLRDRGRGLFRRRAPPAASDPRRMDPTELERQALELIRGGRDADGRAGGGAAAADVRRVQPALLPGATGDVRGGDR